MKVYLPSIVLMLWVIVRVLVGMTPIELWGRPVGTQCHHAS